MVTFLPQVSSKTAGKEGGVVNEEKEKNEFILSRGGNTEQLRERGEKGHEKRGREASRLGS